MRISLLKSFAADWWIQYQRLYTISA